jgi:hypothetical protein
MRPRTEPCKKCNLFDFYYRGDFSYCRPCHAESQRRYRERIATGETLETVKPPSYPLYLLSSKNNFESKKVACPKGHPLRGDNVRITSQRKGSHVNRKCRACDRDSKRVRYGLEEETTSVRLIDLLE